MKTKILSKFAVAASFVVATSGCVSFEELSDHNGRSHYDTQHSMEASELATRLQQKFKFNDSVYNGLLNKKYARGHNELVPLNTKATLQSANKIEIDLSVRNSPKFTFGPGEYSLKRNARSTQVLQAWVVEQVAAMYEEIAAHERQTGDRYGVSSQIECSADGIPVRASGVPYNGMYGRITVPASAARLNQVPTAFDIKPGQGMNNAELSLVRCVALSMVLSVELQHLPPVSYEVMTTLSRGEEYRFVRIHLQLEEK